MRRALVLCLTATLVACGSDGDDNGGNGNPGATVNVTGANTFTATNAIGFSTPTPVTCSVDVTGTPVSVSTAIIAVFVTDVPGDVCTLVNAHHEKKGAGGVGIIIARGHISGGAPTPLGPGTYSITSGSSLPTPDAQGNVTFASAFASKNPAGACGADDIEAESGTITISSVSGGVISGSVDGNIKAADGGGKISGSFTSAACALTTNVCDSPVDDSPDACVD